jgi:hypothetical protein
MPVATTEGESGIYAGEPRTKRGVVSGCRYAYPRQTIRRMIFLRFFIRLMATVGVIAALWQIV